MQCRSDVWRQQVLKKIGAFNAHATKIGQASALPLAIQFANTTQQPLNTDEIPLPMLCSISGQKGSVAAPEFNLERLIVDKELIERKSLQNGRQAVNK